MLISKVIFVLSLVFVFSACEDTPQGVGTYKAPTGNVNQKQSAVDASKLKFSIFNIGHFGDPTKEDKVDTRSRASAIRKTLNKSILGLSNISVFLDIIDYKYFVKTIGETLKCGPAGATYENNLQRYIAVCHHADFKVTRTSKDLEKLELNIMQNSPPVYGAKFKYENEKNPELEYEFYLVVVDYSRNSVLDSASKRELLSEEIALAVSEYSKDLPVIVIGDWRNTSGEEMEKHQDIFKSEFSNIDLLQAKENTVINTDESNPMVQKYNNILFNSDIWGAGLVKNLGACNQDSGQIKYIREIGLNCPTVFILERKL